MTTTEAPAGNDEPRVRWRWFVDRFETAQELGIFGTERRVELLAGTVYEVDEVKPAHADVRRALDELLGDLLDRTRFTLGSQEPVVLSDEDEPEPDSWVARGPRRPTYVTRHPGPADLLVVVEVGDASLAEDRRLKLPRYAIAAVPTVWLIDVRSRRVEVYIDPDTEKSAYAPVQVLRVGDRLSLPAAGVDLAVADLFPDPPVVAQPADGRS